jgi:uncharacterized RDD family membrane protein YckC
MQNPPSPPPPPGDYPPPPPPAGGYPPLPPPPPQMAGGYPPAYAPTPYVGQASYGGFWIRFLAIFLDGLIISIPLIIVGVILGAVTGLAIGLSGNTNGQAVSTATVPLVAFIRIIAFALTLGYFVYFWGTGSTPAMRLFRLRVVDANTGAPIGYGRAALRYLGYLISVFVCYIGLIWAAFDGRKQGWHDKIANTVVLQG